jgi:hypothetical protein
MSHRCEVLQVSGVKKRPDQIDDHEANAMQEAVDPHAMLEALEGAAELGRNSPSK